MRITWKDSNCINRKEAKYRNHIITPYKGGWITDLPDDNNIYKSSYCAKNAIDKALGGTSIRGRGTEKRRSYGIQIVGTLNE